MVSIVPPAPPDDAERMLSAAGKWFRSSGVLDEAVRAGEMVPHFRLTAADGASVDLDDLLNRAPTIIVFVVGGDSLPCQRYLAAWKEALATPATRRTALVVLVPSPLAACRRLAQALGLDLPVLADAGGAVARLFGLAYRPPQPVRDWFVTLGLGAPLAATVDAVVMPAVFLVDQAGVARTAALSPDPFNRPDIAAILQDYNELTSA